MGICDRIGPQADYCADLEEFLNTNNCFPTYFKGVYESKWGDESIIIGPTKTLLKLKMFRDRGDLELTGLIFTCSEPREQHHWGKNPLKA